MAGNGILGFIEWARRELEEYRRRHDDGAAAPGWAWMMARVLSCCQAHPRGVTEGILLAELFQAWGERERGRGRGRLAENHPVMQMKRRRGARYQHLANAVTVDSILEKKFVSLDAVMEVVVLDIHVLPGSNGYLLTLGDLSSGNTVDHYLHRKFFDMVQDEEGTIKRGRDLRMTGCRLRVGAGSCAPRLLPTEHLVVLLDEDQEHDAMLLGAQFLSDTFSSIQRGAAGDHHIYAKLEKSMETETSGDRRWKTILLVDSEGITVPFVLWNDQVSIANLLSDGSMLALERPFVNCDTMEMGLESGSCTRIYCVPPCLQLEQEVTVASDHETCLGSEVLIPSNPHGAIDLNDFPARLLVKDLRPKMFSLAVYGTVAFVGRQISSAKCRQPFILSINDDTGIIEIELQFMLESWSFGEVYSGQLVFISGLATYTDTGGRMKCSWTESTEGASFVNVSHLTAVISSPCLHSIVPVSRWSGYGQVCRIRVERVELQLHKIHGACGRRVTDESGAWFCSFCTRSCDQASLSFHADVYLFDVGEPGREICAGVDGEAAFNLLQVSPETFRTWPEDEQVMYLLSFDGEEFLVSFFQSQGKLCIGCAVK
ncbi:uncharacterized protein LOC9634852 [Selaginella moellendorffii]|uniref:uncharacterized protein LOC9634852 n=1 Tax=Selaginella moellendorffii TaxID=88036 RepID=UPI000D1CF225|nr:uncharacterized protein LOC9634852 [Selaginella moellendorffii]|eukprot:XP_024542647.1 uncharacterized protein LOC9634852 [Selaginella moellendorffii]